MRRDTTAGDEGNHNESALLDNLKDSLGKINTVNFNSLRDGLVGALKNPSSQLLKQVKLPENMDLNQLKEGLNDRTRSAEQYLQRFGTEVLSNLKNTVTILAPEEESPEPEQEEGGGVENGPRIYATRREALIAKMQTNENTYLKEPEITREDEKKVYETFKSTFNINEYTGEIAQLLEGCPKLREMMNTLVPVEVSYSLFWQRYFYHAWKIDQDEQKRQLIVQQHQEEDEDEEDFKWDSDDEEEEKEDVSKSDNKNESSNEEKDDDKTAINDVKKDESSAKEQPIRVSTSSHSEDTDDFSHISADEPNKTEDEWVKAEEKKSDKEEVEEDSDSDWE
ncbi:hypothetical protein BDF20DRAFT_79075 [Mycotypha africana]|uniref:uncharacterized protein n=1 Tax=Mycotypha africana TaxID=64632 RepID=UPI0023006566|nr:uncharacterized protein BDF20DRAFT_79075 [Mycotypha africana]KAI8991973.1 hypothetical protein BDF20DRAFT_79075 [Mycotypha africana]